MVSEQMSREAHRRLPLMLLAVTLALCGASVLFAPAGPLSWLLEVGPGLVGIAVLVYVYPRFAMSHWVYVCVFLHVVVINYGGIYTYAKTPLGLWAQEAFSLSRNHYDRIGHIALGVFPAFIIREVLLRRTPLVRGGWLYFITVCVVLAIAAFWELLEWWVTLIVADETGTAFLGAQGDVWDAQWDMFLAQLGAMAVLAVFAKAHDKSMARVPG